jgi:hypothetical protein
MFRYIDDETLYKRVFAQINFWLMNCDGSSFHNITKLCHFNTLRRYGEFRVYQMIVRIAEENSYIFQFSNDKLSIRISPSHPTRIARGIL